MDTFAPVTLSDDRLVLACPTLALVEQIRAACQDRALHRWLEALPDPYTEQDAREFVAESRRHWEDGTEQVFAVTSAHGGRLLGMVGLHDLRKLTSPGGGVAEVGYWTVAAERGAGVMTDAVRLVCRYGFDQLALARIEWQAEVGNNASWRVARKCGFVMEGTCRRRLLHVGERVDGWLAGLLPQNLTVAAAR